MPHRVLVIDDNEALASALAELLERKGFGAEAVFDASEALARLAQGNVDMLLVDLDIAGTSGAQLVRELRRQGLSVPAVLITAREARQVECEIEGEQLTVIEKPISTGRLLDHIREMLKGATEPQAGERPVIRTLLTFCMEVRLELNCPQEVRLLMHTPSPGEQRGLPHHGAKTRFIGHG